MSNISAHLRRIGARGVRVDFELLSVFFLEFAVSDGSTDLSTSNMKVSLRKGNLDVVFSEGRINRETKVTGNHKPSFNIRDENTEAKVE